MWRKRNPATVTWLSTAALHLQSCLNLSLAPVLNLASCLRELQVAMLSFLVKKAKQKLWEYGPTAKSVIDLEGIEIQYDVLQRYDCAGREGEVRNKAVHSAIRWLCINESDKVSYCRTKHLSALSLTASNFLNALCLQAIFIPEVERIIQTKWERVGYPYFLVSFLVHSFLTMCVTLLLVFINTAPRTEIFYSSVVGIDVVTSAILPFFTTMLDQEVLQVARYGWKCTSFRGVARYDKALRVIKILAYFSFMSLSVCEKYRGNTRTSAAPTFMPTAAPTMDGSDSYAPEGAPGAGDWYDFGIKISVVICVASSYLHLYYYFMGFDRTGPFVLTMFRIITQDVPYFMQFYCLIVVATACSLSLLRDNLNSQAGGFTLLARVIYKLIQDTVGVEITNYSINDLSEYPEHLQWIVNIVLTFYRITVIILMLNLLIAMISNTYAAYCEYNKTILLIEKYNIMDAMEWVMQPERVRGARSKYARVDEQGRKHARKSAGAEEGVVDALDQRVDREARALRRYYDAGAGTATVRLSAKPTAAVVTSAALDASTKACAAGNPSVEAVAELVNPPGLSLSAKPRIYEEEQADHARFLFELPAVNDDWHGSVPDTSFSGNTADLDGAAIARAPQTARLKSSSKTTLLIVDPQADFYPGGAVDGWASAEDSARIGKCNIILHDLYRKNVVVVAIIL
jgi:hypothetical protein